MHAHLILSLLLCLSLFACGGDSDELDDSKEVGKSHGQGSDTTDARSSRDTANTNKASSAGKPSNAGQKIVIVDRGMNMPIARLTIPAGWRLFQDVATNTNTAAYDRYLIDVQSPDGMLIRGLGSAAYSHNDGTNFDSIVGKMALAGVEEISDLSYGEFEPNQAVMAQPTYQQAMQQARSARGQQLQAVHLRFTGTASGRPVAGRLQVDHRLFSRDGQHTGGMVNLLLLISAPEQIETLEKISSAIIQGAEPNPAYDDARARVMAAAHHQRMAQNKAQFDNHQAMMKGRYRAADAQNSRWLQNFRSSGGSSSSPPSGYSSHDKFIDSIGETTRFNDPDSGTQVRRDGQFDNWATDNQGNYIGSDDPSFEPNAIEGNWQEAAPLQ